MESISTDVLIIGAGAAGIRAAIAACESGADVVMVAAEDVAYGGATFSEISNGWGIQALVGTERSAGNLEDFYDDIIRVGLGQSDPDLVRILVEESGPRIDDLIRYGLKFRKSSDGKYIRARGCFSKSERAFLTSDMANIRQTFLSILRRLPVRVVTGTATDLILAEGACQGSWLMIKSGKFVSISAKSTILATGGGSGIFKDHLGNGAGSGDGYALAHRAGAELTNMEFIQFALGLKNNGTRKFLPIGQLTQPDRIINAAGCDILKKYIPDSSTRSRILKDRQAHMPFSCRDSAGLVDIGVAEALQKNTRLFWQHNGSGASRFEVAHLAHAFNGGVKINDRGESTVPGLYAAGEVATGAYGADRIGGCMMTATQVFGKRAGQFAAERAKKSRKKFTPPSRQKGVNSWQQSEISDEAMQAFGAIERRVKSAMGQHAGVLRCKKGLKKCTGILETSTAQLQALELCGLANTERYYKVRNMLITANLVVEAALARQKSKGSHYREDDRKAYSS
jgi:succinate dehydrogenase/fumarate reductase flavoprotein subunit